MKRAPNEPLTPEERALADRLARLGPHDGPSPDMDARILSAAHAATAAQASGRSQRRRRWLGLSGGAGGLVTGLGLAASLTLVLGVVWQMRPMENTVPIPRGEAEGDAMVVEHLPRRAPPLREISPPPAEPVATQARPAAPAPAAEPAPATAPAESGFAATPVDAGPDAMAARQAKAHEDASREAARASEAEQARALERTRQSERAEAQAEVAAMAAPPPPPPPPPASAADEPAPDATAATARRPTYTRSARATSQGATRPLHDVAGAAPAVPAPAIERDAGLPPVEADRALEADAWLQRIRDRRDAGQVDAARESLAAFRLAHPDVPLPDDLHGLADDPGR